MKYVWEHLEEFFIIPLMFAMSIIIFIQVIMRYVFQNSLTWSEELARYMFVWLVYFAVSFTARREKHIRIDAAINLYPKKIRPYIEILSEIIVLAFSIFIAITGVTVVGFVLTAIRQIECIIKRIKNLNKPEEVSKV